MDKKASLKKLEDRLYKEFSEEEIWLFPSGTSVEQKYIRKKGRAVKGFLGTGEKTDSANRIMIIAERPSAGEFDGKVGHFYDILEENGMSNSHLTDFIKTRAPTNYSKGEQERLGFYEKEFPKHLPYARA